MHIHTSANIDELSHRVAEWMIDYINKILQHEGKFTLVLSGGSTPGKLYKLLASEKYKSKIEWRNLHIFWGDERYVPFNDERSNAKMAVDNLLNHVPVPASQIHIMRTDIPPETSANEYEHILYQYFNQSQTSNSKPQTFDLVLLGLGDDAHTLSLFPGTPVIHEKEKWCTSFWLQTQNMYRITLTAPVVNQSACIAFLVSGAGKAAALRNVLKDSYQPDAYPSQIIQPANGELHWFIDEDAASELE